MLYTLLEGSPQVRKMGIDSPIQFPGDPCWIIVTVIVLSKLWYFGVIYEALVFFTKYSKCYMLNLSHYIVQHRLISTS